MAVVEILKSEKISVKYLQVEAEVRYWEDAKVNGVEDQNGTLIPGRRGDIWFLIIDLDAGRVEGWPSGTIADIHYKVADAGRYTLLDADRKVVKSLSGYVPKIMSPGGDGYGDYIIMKIDGEGRIENWIVDLRVFDETD